MFAGRKEGDDLWQVDRDSADRTRHGVAKLRMDCCGAEQVWREDTVLVSGAWLERSCVEGADISLVSKRVLHSWR
jgi:hypothetical protein